MEVALIDPPVDYRRMARRLRCRLGNDPAGKQRALAALARHADRAPRVSAEPQAPSVDSGVRAFAQAVSTAMEGPILRFSRREALIRQAESLGIRRFDANLLIAAVQHRLGNRGSESALPRGSRMPLGILIAIAIALQGLIGLAVWHVLQG